MSSCLQGCKRCGGRLFIDEGDLACLQCGAREEVQEKFFLRSLPAVANPSPAPSPPAISPLIPSEFNTPWFDPRYIKFVPEHVIFLLIHLEMLRSGRYPPDPRTSGYTDIPIARTGGQRNRHAYFTLPATLAAEIDSRLARCSLDRYLVEDHYCRGIPEEDLACRLDMDVWEVRRRINSAVSYISSGPCPRWLNCVDCPSYSSCRHKKRVGKTYREWKRNRRKKYSERPLPALSQAGTSGRVG